VETIGAGGGVSMSEAALESVIPALPAAVSAIPEI